MVALVLGKPVGVFLATFVAVKTAPVPPCPGGDLARRAAGRPAGRHWLHHGHFCRRTGLQPAGIAGRCQDGHSRRIGLLPPCWACSYGFAMRKRLGAAEAA